MYIGTYLPYIPTLPRYLITSHRIIVLLHLISSSPLLSLTRLYPLPHIELSFSPSFSSPHSHSAPSSRTILKAHKTPLRRSKERGQKRQKIKQKSQPQQNLGLAGLARAQFHFRPDLEFALATAPVATPTRLVSVRPHYQNRPPCLAPRQAPRYNPEFSILLSTLTIERSTFATYIPDSVQSVFTIV
ncbi:uncharacterized protein LY79DRAFT_413095 [Colletotrichum navitas]|uniref:Uncharacterized protein n=1 Tax=Colletotrichum navitas TaxID=681940 RepID=A0AAD8V0K4_9PEZI|nr:uncharacterized protein LY79DRAFT_413095 [Colletotrichum navitas]KAK1573375.1 hypothetical protein LY79DRAFT_413095 [Colletotrichum navitas]